MSILVIGAVFVDIKGFPYDNYLPTGRNAGRVEYVHGGVARNVVEDIANVELRPIFLSIVDDTPMGTAVVQKLQRHKVNTDYVLTRPDGMGTWLAVFDNNGDVAGSISKRPNMYPIAELLAQRGEEIFAEASSVVLEIGLDKEIVKSTLSLAQKHHVKTIALVANMSIAAERRDLLPAGGRYPVSGRLRGKKPGGNAGHSGPANLLCQDSLHGGNHGCGGCRVCQRAG